MLIEENIKKAAACIREADALFITAGSGIGVDSGLPDFRGDQGFWKAYPPIAKLGISFSRMANPDWFTHNPALAWAFYGHRLNLYRKTVPHKGFTLLLEIARQKKGGYFVFTSNVDGQFQKAGFDENRIEECHGSIHYLQCITPCSNEIWSADRTKVDIDEDLFEAQKPMPSCKNCSSIARPNILMFGDWSWIADRTYIQGERLSGWFNNIIKNKISPVIIEIGAGEAVPTVRYTSENAALNYQGILIRINPRDYRVPLNHIGIPLGCLEAIEKISGII
jgi:NAD-dependent SIR2 family protein deacetylase